MPNTLVHFGVQGAASRALARDVDAKWIFLGCIIPDVPWIIQRVVSGLWSSVDPYSLRLYATVQASLAACLLFSAALALISKHPGVIFAVLALNSFLGLGLDALQTKWANGVHLFAPLSWDMLNFGLFWPESIPNYLLTIFGLRVFLRFAGPTFGKPVVLMLRKRRRVLLALAFLLAWAITPLVFLTGPENQDNHFVRTLRATELREGRAIELDRAEYFVEGGREYVRTYTGEKLAVIGQTLGHSGTVSVRGTFVDAQTIRIHERHEHSGAWRDWASILGLTLLLGLWMVGLWRSSPWGRSDLREQV